MAVPARQLLAAIRLANGTTALLAPHAAAKRLGIPEEERASAAYPLRLFGARTVVIGAELLVRDAKRRRHALDVGVLIHASDTLAAALGGLRRQLPPRTATMLTLLSAGNTALALLARRQT
jgi:hypothetical protein